MNIVCDKCQSKFKIPDEKLPAGKSASFPCPRCKSRITLNPMEKEEKKPPFLENEEDNENGDGEINESNYDASEKPFDFAEEEGKTALLCEYDSDLRKKIVETLEIMEYHVTEAQNVRDALKKMRYHNFELIVLNEAYDVDNPGSNGVLIYIERLNMAVRRNMFVALVSSRYRTMDNMTAFLKSVDLIINSKNIDEIGKILARGITDNDFFYRSFKESLSKAGRI
jgi:predicted Zn finger-like uncharacterized protein